MRACVRLEDWPAAGRQAWYEALRPGDVLDPGGAGSCWASATRDAIIAADGRWLTWLTRNRPCSLGLPLSKCLTPEAVGEYVAHLRSMNAPGTVVNRIEFLVCAARAMAPETDWNWLSRLGVRLKWSSYPVRTKTNRLVGSNELFAFGMCTMAEADRAASAVNWRSAMMFRDGLIIAFLAARPIRMKNLTAIDIVRHLIGLGSGYALRFEASETKMRRRLGFPVPHALIAGLERYLSVYRPILIARSGKPGSMTQLWISTAGTALKANSIYCRIVRLTKVEFGKPINPHLFRDCAATSIATMDPEHVMITKEVLGHGTLRASERSYNHANSLVAMQTWQDHILAIRKRARKCGREASFRKPRKKIECTPGCLPR